MLNSYIINKTIKFKVVETETEMWLSE